MQSKVTFNNVIITSGNDAEQVNESIYFYDIAFGYEFIENINYSDPLEESAGGDVEIHFNAHGFVAGDQIIITQADDGVANPAVDRKRHV